MKLKIALLLVAVLIGFFFAYADCNPSLCPGGKTMCCNTQNGSIFYHNQAQR